MRTRFAAFAVAVLGCLAAHSASAAPVEILPAADLPDDYAQPAQYYGEGRGYGYDHEDRREEWRRRRWMEERMRREEWRRERWREEHRRRDYYAD